MQEFVTHSDTLSELGSTQANESLNNTVASKAPKAVFFSGSESNDFRVAAAVAQKNLGHKYVLKVILVMLEIGKWNVIYYLLLGLVRFFPVRFVLDVLQQTLIDWDK